MVAVERNIIYPTTAMVGLSEWNSCAPPIIMRTAPVRIWSRHPLAILICGIIALKYPPDTPVYKKSNLKPGIKPLLLT